jgi:inner membrane protein
MDTITQITLGAAVGQAILGRQIGRRALLWGGICGLLPDLDVLIPFDDAVKAFTYHRGASHSLFVLAVLTPVMAWIAMRLHAHTHYYRRRWYALVYAAFTTHVLLDCFTVYGTQIFWPLSVPPVMWSTVFIIDPAYTIPLAIGVLTAALMKRHPLRGHHINTICLALSTLYLVWSVGAKLYVSDVVRDNLNNQHINHRNYLTMAAPFNTLVWRVLVMDANGYYEGFYSLLDRSRHIRFTHYASDTRLIRSLGDQWSVKRLQWFTHGFYSVRNRDDHIVITDLRMGFEPIYVFQFKVARLGNPHPVPIRPARIRENRSMTQLQEIWQRFLPQ